MRTIALGLSACLSACVSTLPVANTNRDPLPAASPLEQDEPPKPRQTAPRVTRVAGTWIVNLASRLDPFEVERLPAPEAFENRLVYVAQYPLVSRTLHRLRLGFFASEAQAEAARAALSDQYPHAYVTRAASAERALAAQHAPTSAASAASDAHSAPRQADAPSAPVAAGTEYAAAASAGEAPYPAPYAAASSQRPAERTGLSVEPPLAPRSEPASEVSYGRDEDETLFVRSTHRGGDLFTVGTAFSQREDMHDLQKRAAEEQGFWQLDLSSTAAGAGPAIEAKFAQSSFDPETSQGFGSSENRMLRLATHGSWQAYQLGLDYQAVGTEFEKPSKVGERKKAANHPKAELKQGRQGTEAWIARQFGDLGLKTLAGVYQDQGQGDADGERFTTQKLGASLNYSILSWPQVGVTVDYARGVRSGGERPGAGQSPDIDVESIASSLYYAGAAWSGTLYVEDAAGAGTDTPMDLRTYYLGGSYYPWGTFSLSPGLTYSEESYTQWGSSTDSYAASMTASYKPSAKSRFSFTGYSEYSIQQNLEWALDTEYYYNSLGVNWISDKPKPLIKQWSFEVFHDQYIDNVYSDSNTGGLGFWLTLKSAPSPINRFVNEVR